MIYIINKNKTRVIFVVLESRAAMFGFLDFKNNIVLYFTISPIYRIDRLRCV